MVRNRFGVTSSKPFASLSGFETRRRVVLPLSRSSARRKPHGFLINVAGSNAPTKLYSCLSILLERMRDPAKNGKLDSRRRFSAAGQQTFAMTSSRPCCWCVFRSGPSDSALTVFGTMGHTLTFRMGRYGGVSVYASRSNCLTLTTGAFTLRFMTIMADSTDCPAAIRM